VFEDYSHKEIAEALQITENHSYHLLHQARKQLKSALQKQTEKELKYEQK
jgi:DNA-directed RNA polymerase specialized sigma24 family protein